MTSLTKDQMSQVLDLMRSENYATWSPLVEKRAYTTAEHLVQLLRQHLPAEQFDPVQSAFKEVLKVEIIRALLEATEVQRGLAPAKARKARSTKTERERRLTQQVAMDHLGPDGRIPPSRSLVEPVRKARAAAGFEPEAISHVTINRHIEAFVLVSFYQSETED